MPKLQTAFSRGTPLTLREDQSHKITCAEALTVSQAPTHPLHGFRASGGIPTTSTLWGRRPPRGTMRCMDMSGTQASPSPRSPYRTQTGTCVPENPQMPRHPRMGEVSFVDQGEFSKDRFAGGWAVGDRRAPKALHGP